MRLDNMIEKQEMSIAELALKFEKSQDTIRRLLKHVPMHCIRRVEKGKKLINADGIHVLSDLLRHSSYADAYAKKDLHMNYTQPEEESFKGELKFLKQQLNVKDEQILKLNNQLDKQLEKKDHQILELHKRLAESQELNRNQQILLKNEQEKLLLLENNNKGIFERIFKRKK
jgi:hypothetical protein